MRVFVSNASLILKIKSRELREFMSVGSCLRTPLEKKCTFDYAWGNLDGYDSVNSITVYKPGSNIPHSIHTVDISLADWCSIMTPVSEYSFWREDIEEKDRINNLIKIFEDAAIEHGARKITVANGFISDPELFLAESGKKLTKARNALRDEFNL
ncbi:hypothetical protein BI049_gp172 [Salmonella phage vB_SnwM_CGG4-1]|uniref:Uncharacterized protein n=1 Tax=Salmonella phage vB_SnwM_CGG4-1 TaxID=1815631 RepID=A0A1B0VVN0_9CAUD|nr:hypothetical protein BI049_gp172 [Salmonella phage vB_SnwM_CGG4-1]ANA49561.1 hypothetical protein CGG41_206 [Salmonella phage vB_SnwM_CGG4-1]